MTASRIPLFDVWRAHYALSTVTVFRAGTTTLAELFYDPEQTEPAPNPQTLVDTVIGGIPYGKWERPVYTPDAYYLDIDGVEQTGVVRQPLYTLEEAVGNNIRVTTTRGTNPRRLRDRFDNEVFAEDFGTLEEDNSSSTNLATIQAALGAAAAQGGGRVLTRQGTFQMLPFTIPVGVILEGFGPGATVFQCTEGQEVVTIAGDGAGLRNITIDGVNLIAGSIGLYSKANNGTVLENVVIKRFADGMVYDGGRYSIWRNLSVLNCTNNVKLNGDAKLDDSGDEFSHNFWNGGEIGQSTGIGLLLNYENTSVRHNTFRGLRFLSNSGTAIKINGARYTEFIDTLFDENVTALDVADDTDTSKVLENTVIGLHFRGGRVADGTLSFDNTCQDVAFQDMQFGSVVWDLTLPINAILLRDVTESPQTALSGDTSKLQRFRTSSEGEVVGVTTDANSTVAWAYRLEPGEVAYIEATIVGRRRDGEDTAVFVIGAGAIREGDHLDYDNQTSDFTAGAILTGQVSGATARIAHDQDDGSTGTLVLRDIVGEFLDNETITDSEGGSATANGTPAAQNARLDRVGETTIRNPHSTVGNLNYDGQSANFVIGRTLTGSTSGATARIEADTDGGTTGTLRLVNIKGTFQNDETITGSDSGGSATANGTVSFLYDAEITVSGQDLRVSVKGFAGHTVEWSVRVRTVASSL
jgi:hypothetical protein